MRSAHNNKKKVNKNQKQLKAKANDDKLKANAKPLKATGKECERTKKRALAKHSKQVLRALNTSSHSLSLSLARYVCVGSCTLVRLVPCSTKHLSVNSAQFCINIASCLFVNAEVDARLSLFARFTHNS